MEQKYGNHIWFKNGCRCVGLEDNLHPYIEGKEATIKHVEADSMIAHFDEYLSDTAPGFEEYDIPKGHGLYVSYYNVEKID